jgi:hypothetical protein
MKNHWHVFLFGDGSRDVDNSNMSVDWRFIQRVLHIFFREQTSWHVGSSLAFEERWFERMLEAPAVFEAAKGIWIASIDLVYILRGLLVIYSSTLFPPNYSPPKHSSILSHRYVAPSKILDSHPRHPNTNAHTSKLSMVVPVFCHVFGSSPQALDSTTNSLLYHTILSHRHCLHYER